MFLFCSNSHLLSPVSLNSNKRPYSYSENANSDISFDTFKVLSNAEMHKRNPSALLSPTVPSPSVRGALHVAHMPHPCSPTGPAQILKGDRHVCNCIEFKAVSDATASTQDAVVMNIATATTYQALMSANNISSLRHPTRLIYMAYLSSSRRSFSSFPHSRHVTVEARAELCYSDGTAR